MIRAIPLRRAAVFAEFVADVWMRLSTGNNSFRARWYCERKLQVKHFGLRVHQFVMSHTRRCLDRFVIFGEQHMDHVCQEYLAHYHEERPHQSLENVPIAAPKKRGRPKTKRGNVEREIVPLSEVRCKQRLGGLLRSYSRRVA